MEHYNRELTRQGKRCQGNTPIQTFLDGIDLAHKKRIEPLEPPPRMGPGHNWSEAAVEAAFSAA